MSRKETQILFYCFNSSLQSPPKQEGREDWININIKNLYNLKTFDYLAFRPPTAKSFNYR